MGYRQMLYFYVRMKNLVIFASGNGTNAENLIRYFKGHAQINIHSIITNKEHAGVIDKAQALNIPTHYFSNETFKSSPEIVLQHLKSMQIDGIVLAGFLLLFPAIIIEQYPNKIINVHPALLPKYGGKGMYGMHVHKAVIAHNEKESGISVHYVNEKYDEGTIILQAKCDIAPSDTALDLVKKINALELEYLPKAIEMVFNK
jgi:phosphoribosylglycinamide formyltransferase 1